MKLAWILLVAATILMSAPTCPASVPDTMCVQGILNDVTTAQPVTGSVDFGVAIFDAAVDGNQVWPPDDNPAVIPGVAVVSGLFRLTFGDSTLTPQLFGQPLWVEISTGAAPVKGLMAMAPRITLRTAPYAFRVGFVGNEELTDAIEAGSSTPGNTGSLGLFNDAGAKTAVVKGSGQANAGEIDLMGTGGALGITLKGGIGEFLGQNFGGQVQVLKHSGGPGVVIEGAANSQIIVYNNNDVCTVELFGDEGGYGRLGGDGGSELRMRNGQPLNADTIELDGNDPQHGGKIILGDKDGYGTIRLQADVAAYPHPSGVISVFGADQTAGPRIDVVGDSGEAGSFIAMVNAASGTTLRFLSGLPGEGGILEVRNSNNEATVVLNGENGKVCAQTFSTSGGCDVAETFQYTHPNTVQPGMVMVIDPAKAGHLKVSDSAYDVKVAGIVSGAGGLRPGVKLGGTGGTDDDRPIALSGRVYCLVDATECAVEVGDLLTTSNSPGHAMTATDRDRALGAMLGKAMEPLPKGQKGLILVLVALQ